MSILSLSSRDVKAADFTNDLEFDLTLKKPLMQVVGFSLLEAIIPFTWYPVPDIKITYTKVLGIDDSETPGSTSCNAGHYSATELATALTNSEILFTYDATLDSFKLETLFGQTVTASS